MSYSDPRPYDRIPHLQRSRGCRDRVLNDRTHHMRRIGLAMCVVSATITLVSATLIAIRL